jgi:hypothetical protein
MVMTAAKIGVFRMISALVYQDAQTKKQWRKLISAAVGDWGWVTARYWAQPRPYSPKPRGSGSFRGA